MQRGSGSKAVGWLLPDSSRRSFGVAAPSVPALFLAAEQAGRQAGRSRAHASHTRTSQSSSTGPVRRAGASFLEHRSQCMSRASLIVQVILAFIVCIAALALYPNMTSPLLKTLVVPAASGTATASVIFAHGLGDSGLGWLDGE